MTGLTIGTNALTDIGVLAQGETPNATMQADMLTRLNNLVASWLIQRLTVLATERQVFNTVANQATYFIGLGAQFNVNRPQHIDTGALLLNGLNAPITVTSVARSGFVATVTQTSHGYSVGDQSLILGATPNDYNGTQTVLTVPTSNTWTYQLQSSTLATPATGTITAQSFNAADGTPPATEIPRAVLTVDSYAAIQVKNLPNSQFTNIYYIPTFPFGQVFLWPTPDNNQNQVVLYLDDQFTGFADLTTDYQFPLTPGYADALEYNLAMRLSEPYGRTLPTGVLLLAKQSLGLLKRANYKLTDLQVDPAFTADRRGGYNINTGNM